MENEKLEKNTRAFSEAMGMINKMMTLVSSLKEKGNLEELEKINKILEKILEENKT